MRACTPRSLLSAPLPPPPFFFFCWKQARVTQSIHHKSCTAHSTLQCNIEAAIVSLEIGYFWLGFSTFLSARYPALVWVPGSDCFGCMQRTENSSVSVVFVTRIVLTLRSAEVFWRTFVLSLRNCITHSRQGMTIRRLISWRPGDSRLCWDVGLCKNHENTMRVDRMWD